MIELALSVFAPLPRLSVLALDELLVPMDPDWPGVAPLLSPTSIVPAVMTLLTASDAVALALVPTPTMNSFPPAPLGTGPVPVVKLKFDNVLMSSTGVMRAVLVLLAAIPTTKLELPA